MKNNAIMFMIDSVVWETVGTNRCRVSPTPFMDSLKREGLWTNNLYSHGPYTDAATRSLYTGRNTLDDFGYFIKLNGAPVTHYKAFKDNGYETIGFYYPYYMMGNNVTQYIDKLYFKAGFEFGSEWGGIFSYYCDIRKQRPLNETELFMIKKRMELMFEVWCNFYVDLTEHPGKVKNLNDIMTFADVQSGREKLFGERAKFEANQNEYIEDFLFKGQDHLLNEPNDVSIDNRISRDYLNKVHDTYPAFFKLLQRNNLKANLFSTMPSPKRIFTAFAKYLKTKNKDEFAFLENYLGGLMFFKQVRNRWGGKRWQNMPSTQFQLNFVESEIIPNRDKSKPFFLCLNIEEAHNNLSFFTYDIQDDKLMEEEIAVLHSYLKELGTNFKGNIVYYLGLRYMDYCIEKFCNYLKSEGLWENTSLLFTADHGSSYTFYPVHGPRVNNFHDECYHIPVLMRHPGMKPKEVNTYQYSKDVIPTFMDLLGLELSPYFKGESMIRDNEPRKFVIHEYMGPGCPDIMQRPVWFSIRDERYVVAYKVKLYDDFEKGELCEIYDKSVDPKEYYNVVNIVKRSDVEYLIKEIYTRWKELRNDTAAYYKKLQSYGKGLPINN